MASAVRPGEMVTGRTTDSGPLPAWLDGSRRPWVDRLFPTTTFRGVALRAASLSLVVFFIGHLLARSAGYAWAYWRPWEMLGLTAIAGAIATFLLLVVLGQLGSQYVAVWRETEDAYTDADRPRYRSLVDSHLDRLYTVRPNRIADLKLVPVAFVLFAPVVAIPIQKLSVGLPYHRPFFLYYGLLSLLGIVVVFAFLVHVSLVRSVGRLQLANLYTAADEVGGVVAFGTTVTVVWFTAVTLLALYHVLTLRTYTMSLIDWVRENSAMALLAYPPLELLFQILFLLGLVVLGLAVFLWPVWSLHGGILRTKRELLKTVDERRNELVSGWASLQVTDETVRELDLLDCVDRSTDRIQTWPSLVTDAAKVAISASIPVSQVGLVLLG